MANPKKSGGRKAAASTVTPASPRRRARLTLFFGAGAEASYGLPTGGRFALEVIRRAKDPVDAFKADRVRINGGCTMAYRNWLPVDLMKQRVAHFGKSERSRIFEDSLRSGYARVVASLDAYDASAATFISKHGVARSRVEALFREASGGRDARRRAVRPCRGQRFDYAGPIEPFCFRVLLGHPDPREGARAS